jgi:hypothetical protein
MHFNNFVRRSRNRQAFNYFSMNGRNERLYPLRKERAGAGVALPGLRASADCSNLVALDVGAVVGAPFPATIADFNTLTLPQLSALAIMFNDDFGIVVGDSLDDKRGKFQGYIAGV